MFSIFSTMSAVDIIQSVGVITTIGFSIWGMCQASQANNVATKANNIAKKALNEAQKEFMPMVRLDGEFKVVSKSIKTLRSQVTFDFYGNIVNTNDLDILIDIGDERINKNEVLYSEDFKVTCIEVEIENCGNGILTGMDIDYIFIKDGNKVSITYEADEDRRILASCEEKVTEYFTLLPKEKKIINLLISENIMDEDTQYIREFIQNYDNIAMGMGLGLKSINNTNYEQKNSVGTYLDGKLSSFENGEVIACSRNK